MFVVIVNHLTADIYVFIGNLNMLKSKEYIQCAKKNKKYTK